MIAASVVRRYLDAGGRIGATLGLQFAQSLLQLLIAHCQAVYQLLLARDFIADLLQAGLQVGEADLQVFDSIGLIHSRSGGPRKQQRGNRAALLGQYVVGATGRTQIHGF